MSKKWNEQNLKELVEKEGYTYVSFERYDGSRIRLYLICPNSAEYTCNLHAFNKGGRCQCIKCSSNVVWKDDKIIKMCKENNYKFIKSYKSDKNDICFESICPNNNMFNVKAGDFYRGKRCKCYKCAKDNNSQNNWTIENIELALNDYSYEYISHHKLKNKSIVVKAKNLINNEIYEFNLYRFLKNEGKLRKKDYKTKKYVGTKYTFEYIDNYIKGKSNSKLIEILKKQSVNSLIKVRCECGKEYILRFTEINKNNDKLRCESCRNIKSPTNWYYEKVKYFIEIESDSGCRLLSTQYKNVEEKLKIKCSCGEIFETTFSKFINRNKRQCNKCGHKIISMKKSKTHEDYVSQLNEKTKGEYVILSNYKNSYTKVLMRHACGHEWWVNPTSILFNIGGCPRCAESKGEQIIRKYLENNNIYFEKEYDKLNLLGICGGLLRFDFVIFEDPEKSKIKCLIEYDGEFHYMKLYENDGHDKIKIHDELKNKYCKDSNLKLIRIPYWEKENIDNILKDLIKGRKIDG